MKQKQKIYWSLGTLAIVMALSIAFAFNSERVQSDDDGVSLVFISGTEYVSGQVGKVIVELRDKNYNSINTASCNVGFILPTDSSDVNILPIIGAGTMYYVGAPLTGGYVYNFTAPSSPGVYQYIVQCTNSTKTYRQTKSFHVSSPENLVWIGEGPEVVKYGQSAEFSWRLDSPNDWSITDAKCGVYNNDGVYSGIGTFFYESAETNITEDWSEYQCCNYAPTCLLPSSVTIGASKYGNYDAYNNILGFGILGSANRCGGYVRSVLINNRSNWLMEADYLNSVNSTMVGMLFLGNNCTQPISGQQRNNTFDGGCDYYGIQTLNSTISGNQATWFIARKNGVVFETKISNLVYGDLNPSATVGWYGLRHQVKLIKYNDTLFNLLDIDELGDRVIDVNFSVQENYTNINIDRVYVWGWNQGVVYSQSYDDLSFGVNNMNVSYKTVSSIRSADYSAAEKNVFIVNFIVDPELLDVGRYYIDCDVTYGRFWENAEGVKFWDGSGKVRKYFDIQSNLKAWVQK